MIHSGFYRGSWVSGAMTGVAAGSATAGHIFAFRWTSSSFLALIDYVRVRWQTTTAFTAAQELQFRLFRATGYSAAHTGGTAATLTTPNLKKRVSDLASAVSDIRIGSTGALTAGTHTLDAESLATFEGFSQLGAAPNNPNFDDRWDCSSERGQFILAQNEGFIVRNEVSMGAAGVGRLVIDVGWSEAYP
jgi:hypothetical protein